MNELICTFIFVSVRLTLKLKEHGFKVANNSVSEALGTSIGLLAMLKTGNKLGVCQNPAILLAVTLNAELFLAENTSNLVHYVPFYLIGPVLGACLAALFFNYHKAVILEGIAK